MHKGKLLTQSEVPRAGIILAVRFCHLLETGAGCEVVMAGGGCSLCPHFMRLWLVSESWEPAWGSELGHPRVGQRLRGQQMLAPQQAEPGTFQTAALLHGSSLPSSMSLWSPRGSPGWWLGTSSDAKAFGGTMEALPWQAAAVARARHCVCERATGTYMYLMLRFVFMFANKGSNISLHTSPVQVLFPTWLCPCPAPHR